MIPFSRRYGYASTDIQYECVSETLKNRIFAAFYKQEYDYYGTLDFGNYTTGIEDMMIEMGITYNYPENTKAKNNNAKKLESFLLDSKSWYVIYDFIEKYLYISDDKVSEKMTSTFNRILEEEVSGYRILNKLVVPITSEMELATINEAQNTPYDSVNTHINKALKLFADRKKPDYENSIKESISAVEAMCCIIKGMTGAQATLGNAMKKLKDNGVHIHSAMEKAYASLYGYTSDENGIRHGGTDFTNAPSEDAKYMLVSCSAFVNYLIEKWNKATNGGKN